MKALRSRWAGPEGAALAESVMDRLMHGGDLSGLPLGTHDGRVDLRGISLPKPGKGRPATAVAEIRNQRWALLDFAGASMPGLLFFDASLHNCVFDSADCRDWGLWGSSIHDCNFDRVNLREAAWSSQHPRANEMVTSTLRGADLRGMLAQSLKITDCDFSQARLNEAMFERCAITRCRFAGPMSDVVFDGRDLGPGLHGEPRPAPPELDDVDFHDADFHFVEFRGFTLERTRLPDRPGVHLIPKYRAAATRALGELASDPSKEARALAAWLEYSLRGPFRDEDAHVFNRRDFEGKADGGSPASAALAERVLLGHITE